MTRDEYIDELQARVQAGEVSLSAICAAKWLASHQEEAERMLGIAPCGREECAQIMEALHRENLDELAVLMAYRKLYAGAGKADGRPG